MWLRLALGRERSNPWPLHHNSALSVTIGISWTLCLLIFTSASIAADVAATIFIITTTTIRARGRHRAELVEQARAVRTDASRRHGA